MEVVVALVEEALDGGKPFLGLAFHHVAGEGPRSACKTQNRNVLTDGSHDAPNCFGQETGFRLGVEYPKALDIRFGADWIRQVWAGVAEFQLQAHGFGRNQNVGEHDDGVDAKPAKRLDGNFDGKLRRLANLKECMLCADFAVFRKIPAGLAHYPDGNSRQNFTAAGAKE